MLLKLAGSLVAVLLLAWVAKLLGLGGGALANEAAAKAEAEALVPGFRATAAEREGADWMVRGDGGIDVRLRQRGARHVAEVA